MHVHFPRQAAMERLKPGFHKHKHKHKRCRRCFHLHTRVLVLYAYAYVMREQKPGLRRTLVSQQYVKSNGAYLIPKKTRDQKSWAGGVLLIGNNRLTIAQSANNVSFLRRLTNKNRLKIIIGSLSTALPR